MLTGEQKMSQKQMDISNLRLRNTGVTPQLLDAEGNNIATVNVDDIIPIVENKFELRDRIEARITLIWNIFQGIEEENIGAKYTREDDDYIYFRIPKKVVSLKEESKKNNPPEHGGWPEFSF
jgi:hypothetical protein